MKAIHRYYTKKYDPTIPFIDQINEECAKGNTRFITQTQVLNPKPNLQNPGQPNIEIHILYEATVHVQTKNEA